MLVLGRTLGGVAGLVVGVLALACSSTTVSPPAETGGTTAGAAGEPGGDDAGSGGQRGGAGGGQNPDPGGAGNGGQGPAEGGAGAGGQPRSGGSAGESEGGTTTGGAPSGGTGGVTSGGSAGETTGGAGAAGGASSGGGDTGGAAAAAGAAGEVGCEEGLNTSVEHCGACGRACSAANAASVTCVDGGCAPSCASGFGDCSTPVAPTADNGCETDLRSGVNNCGACGRICSSSGADSRVCTDQQCVPTCTTGFADCARPAAPAPDDGCETNVMASATNCGACGHDCLGGDCVDGRCQPIVLASGEASFIRSMTVGGGFVVWSTDSEVRRVLASGAGPAETLEAVTGGGWNLATDGVDVFWVDYPLIQKHSLQYLSAVAVDLYTEPDTEYSLGAITIDGDRVLFIREVLYDGEVWSVPVQPGAPLDHTIFSYETRSILADGGSLYAATAGGLTRYDLSGGPSESLDTGSVARLDVDDTNVYWTRENLIRGRSKLGGDPWVVASQVAYIWSVSAAEGVVSWSDADDSVRMTSSTGGEIIDLALGQASPRYVHVEGPAVYWANTEATGENPNSILKVAW